MRLNTTDWQILEALSHGKRNNAINLSIILDKNRDYINTRLPILVDYGLVSRVGPSERSGLYEITEVGRMALLHRAEYDEIDDFGEFLAGQVP